MNKKIFITAILTLLIISCLNNKNSTSKDLSAQKNNTMNVQGMPYKWMRITGRWRFNNSSVIEWRGRSSSWKYHELMNYNTIVTLVPFENISMLETNMEILKVKVLPVESLISFAVTSPYKHYYYNFYAIKFTGDANRINKISLIQSKRKDPEKSYKTKNNFTISELYSINYNLDYYRKYNFKLKFDENEIILLINDKKIFKKLLSETDFSGKIGLSNRGASIRVDNIKLFNKNDIVFYDEFDKNSIKVHRAKAVRVKKKQ